MPVITSIGFYLLQADFLTLAIFRILGECEVKMKAVFTLF